MDAKLCTIQYTLGRVETCPGRSCPFWLVERSTEGCVLEPVEREIEPRPDLAQHLVELRRMLDVGRAEAPPERSLFFHLLNEEEDAEAA